MKAIDIINPKLRSAWSMTRSLNVKQCILQIQSTGKATPVRYHSRGRFTHTYDVTAELERVLTAAGIAFKKSNIAPRGGKIGTIIEVIC